MRKKRIAISVDTPISHTGTPDALGEQQELVKKLQSGDPVAMESIFQLYYKRLYFFAVKVVETRMDAEDIVQDVLLKFWINARDNGIVPGHVEGYLFSMVRNRCLNHLERQKMLHERNGAVIEEFYIRQEQRMEELSIQEEIFHRIKENFTQLTPIQAQVMDLLYVQGLSVAEVAAALDTTANNVRNHKARALERLKSGLEKDLLGALIFFFIFFSFFL